ncbi:hypothetical protein [Deinococcus aetherius]|uniref:hypothetical protein n=1 Tax=Deinococcus aetherius TaxID=200252 RepID=UPI00222E9B1A|nr:hypothetical protein [Deinococcus aetherius]
MEFRLSPSASCPERVAIVLEGRVLGHTCGQHLAEFWAQGYRARVAQESRRRGPKGDAQARATWCRGWDRANAHELEREKREKRRGAA